MLAQSIALLTISEGYADGWGDLLGEGDDSGVGGLDGSEDGKPWGGGRSCSRNSGKR